jgi:hypothetical protein
MSIPESTMPGTLWGFGPEPVAGELPQPRARPVGGYHRPWAVLCKPKTMRGEIAVDADAELLFYDGAGVKHGLPTNGVLHPE